MPDFDFDNIDHLTQDPELESKTGVELEFDGGIVLTCLRAGGANKAYLDDVKRALAPLKLARGGNEARGGADLDALGKRGMPILEPNLDGTNYFDVHHTANDTLAQVDPAAIRQSVAAYGVTVWLASQHPGSWDRVTAPKPPRR